MSGERKTERESALLFAAAAACSGPRPFHMISTLVDRHADHDTLNHLCMCSHKERMRKQTEDNDWAFTKVNIWWRAHIAYSSCSSLRTDQHACNKCMQR